MTEGFLLVEKVDAGQNFVGVNSSKHLVFISFTVGHLRCGCLCCEMPWLVLFLLKGVSMSLLS